MELRGAGGWVEVGKGGMNGDIYNSVNNKKKRETETEREKSNPITKSQLSFPRAGKC